MEATLLQKRWIMLGAIAGILGAIFYPIIYYQEIALKIHLLIGLSFALAIGFSTFGIFQFVRIHRDCVCIQVGVVSGLMAAEIYALKISVNSALKAPLEGILVQGDQSFVYSLTSRIDFGIGFLWDILIGISIFAFSVAFLSQPRPGKIISVIGLIVALTIVLLSLYTFPEIPERVNLTGMGPLLPVWHLIVSIIMLSSLKWIKIKSYPSS